MYTVNQNVNVACCLAFSFCTTGQRLFLVAVLSMAQQQAAISDTVQLLFHLRHSEQSNNKKKILSVHRLVALMDVNDVMVNKTLVHSFSS